jgi:hypothetical protein
LFVAPGEDVDGGDEFGFDGVIDEAGEAFFGCEDIVDSDYLVGLVFDSDEQDAAGAVGEGDEGFDDSIGGGEGTFAFEGFALRAAEEGGEVHYPAFYSEGALQQSPSE